MKRKLASTPTLKTNDVKLVSPEDLLKHEEYIFNLISRRAYERFENRGYSHGNDWDDWFRAESELLKPVKCHALESDDHLIAHAEVPGFSPHEIKVSVEPRWLRIGGRTETSANNKTGEAITYSLGHSLLPAEQSFHVAELAAAVDPSRAKVTFKDGMLEIVMPKASATTRARAQTNLNSSVDNYNSDATATLSTDVAVKKTGDKGKQPRRLDDALDP